MRRKRLGTVVCIPDKTALELNAEKKDAGRISDHLAFVAWLFLAIPDVDFAKIAVLTALQSKIKVAQISAIVFGRCVAIGNKYDVIDHSVPNAVVIRVD